MSRHILDTQHRYRELLSRAEDTTAPTTTASGVTRTCTVTSKSEAYVTTVEPAYCSHTKAVYSTTLEQECRVNTTFVRFVHVFGPKTARYSTVLEKNELGV